MATDDFADELFPDEHTKAKQLARHAPYRFTVGELKKRIQDLPDDMEVYYQRIEDRYFEGFELLDGRKTTPWETREVLWESSPRYGDWMTEVIPAFSCYVIDDILIIHAHY